jgi:hypothetical protein
VTDREQADVVSSDCVEYKISEMTIFNLAEAAACFADPSSALNRQLKGQSLSTRYDHH